MLRRAIARPAPLRCFAPIYLAPPARCPRLLRVVPPRRHLAGRAAEAAGGADNSASLGALLFTPDGQLQVAVQLAAQTLTGRELTVLRIAPTTSLLDALDGDVVGALPSVNIGAAVKAGDELMSLHWEGVLMSDADELYHSRFEAASGTHALRAPVDGIVVAYNDALIARTAAGGAEPLDIRGCGGWLVQLQASDPAELLGLVEVEVPAQAAAVAVA